MHPEVLRKVTLERVESCATRPETRKVVREFIEYLSVVPDLPVVSYDEETIRLVWESEDFCLDMTFDAAGSVKWMSVSHGNEASGTTSLDNAAWLVRSVPT
jgi:hypothetical protein